MIQLQRLDVAYNQTVYIKNTPIQLSKMQKEYWDKIDSLYQNKQKNNHLSLLAPTSAGKSFLLIQKIIEKSSTQDSYFVIYIAPSIALMLEIRKKLIDELSNHDINNVGVFSEINQSDQHLRSAKNIYILTQERFNSYIENQFTKINLDFLILDEIQNISEGRHDEDERKESYRRILLYINQKKIVSKVIIFAGVDKKNELNVFLPDTDIDDIDIEFSNKASVINLAYGIAADDDNKYSFKLIDKEFDIWVEIIKPKGWNTKYSSKNQNTGTLHQNIINHLKDEVVLFYINKKSEQYTFLEKHIPSNYEGSERFVEERNSLSNYVMSNYGFFAKRQKDGQQKNIGPELIEQNIKNGIMLHNGDLPKSLRILVELSLKNRNIDKIIANKTLLQGVNLPVKYLIIYTDTDDTTNQLSPTEIDNLRGRAGRLGEDLVGYFIYLNYNTGIISPNSTDDYDFADEHRVTTEKEDHTSVYKEEMIEKISEILQQGSAVSKHNKDNATNINKILWDIICIRMLAFHHGKDGFYKGKFYLHGITEELYFKVVDMMNDLKSSEPSINEYCSQYRTFDPLDLQEISRQNHTQITISSSDTKGEKSQQLKKDLEKLLNEMSMRYEYYYKRIFSSDSKNPKRLFGALGSWIAGHSLFSPHNNNIDYNVYEFVNDISYKLPLLIAPFIHTSEHRDQINGILTYGSIGEWYKFKEISYLELDREFILQLKNYYDRNTDLTQKELFEKSFKDIIKELLASKDRLNISPHVYQILDYICVDEYLQ